MDIFSFFTLCGGLAFFLYGMTVLSDGLRKLAGGRLEQLLKRMTSNPFKSLLLGAGITIAIQSSSAMTVMLVGLVNSGIMQLGQTIGVIMGSNIGTTLTAWLLSLAGIESENVFLRLLKPDSFSPVLALIGIILIMGSKKQQRKDIGRILVGFAILMYGMELMTGAIQPLAESPEFGRLLVAFKNPLLGVLVGAVFTGIIQSSAASVGILQAFSLTGSLTFGMAVPIIMGQNIGTCVTALLSSIGVNKNAKRVGVVHISFNIIGTVVCLTLFEGLRFLFHWEFFDSAISPFGIALSHTIFNVFTTLLLLPFSRQLERISTWIIKDEKTPETYTLLDDRLLLSPPLAVSECYHAAGNMAKLAEQSVLAAIDQFRVYDPKRIEVLNEDEETIDLYEDKLGTFLVKISSESLSDQDSKTTSLLLNSIGDIERIGDYALNLSRVAQEMQDKKIVFSQEAQKEIQVLFQAVTDILQRTTQAFIEGSTSSAVLVEPLEQVIDALIAAIKNRHIKRLQGGSCTIELGFVLSDLLTACARMSDHCSNIAACLIQVDHAVMDTHEYLNSIKNSGDPAFEKAFAAFEKQYTLPF